MNRVVCALTTALVLVSGAAYGQSTSKASHGKQAKHQPLRDKQIDKVTAAGEEQSAIAANNSTVTENGTGTGSLSGSALMGASGVNIVSSADAEVANGANVYNGTFQPNLPTSLNGTEILSSYLVEGTLRLGTTYVYAPGKMVDLSFGVGLTPDTPNLQFSVGFPLRLSLWKPQRRRSSFVDRYVTERSNGNDNLLTMP